MKTKQLFLSVYLILIGLALTWFGPPERVVPEEASRSFWERSFWESLQYTFMSLYPYRWYILTLGVVTFVLAHARDLFFDLDGHSGSSYPSPPYPPVTRNAIPEEDEEETEEEEEPSVPLGTGLIALECPKCGAKLPSGGSIIKCQYCGTNVRVEK
jgi:hypothetical protein